MKVSVDNTYKLFFKYFDSKDDSQRKKAARLCASIAIGVFTLGIYHLIIYKLHQRNIKHASNEAIGSVASSTDSVAKTVIDQSTANEFKTYVTLSPVLARDINQALQDNGIESPDEALIRWRQELDQLKKSPELAPAKFQLLKWSLEGRIVGQEPQISAREILKEAADSGIPEAIYSYCKDYDQDQVLLDNLRAMDSAEAKYYSFLLAKNRTFNAYQVLKESLLKSDCKEGLYNLYLPGIISTFNHFESNVYKLLPLQQLLNLGDPRAFFEKGKLLMNNATMDDRRFLLNEEEKALSVNERALRGVVLVAKAAVKGHREAIEFMIGLFPQKSLERASWIDLRQGMYHNNILKSQ